MLARIGIGRAIAKVVDVKQRTELEALIGIERNGGQRSIVVAGFDNFAITHNYRFLGLLALLVCPNCVDFHHFIRRGLGIYIRGQQCCHKQHY